MNEKLDVKLKEFMRNKSEQFWKLKTAEQKAEGLVHRFNKLCEPSDLEFRTQLNSQRDTRRYLPQISRAVGSRRIPNGMSETEFERLYSIEISRELEETLTEYRGGDIDYDPLYRFQSTLAKTIAEEKIDLELAELIGQVFYEMRSGHKTNIASLLDEQIKTDNVERIGEFFGYVEKNANSLGMARQGLEKPGPASKIANCLIYGRNRHREIFDKFMEESEPEPAEPLNYAI